MESIFNIILAVIGSVIAIVQIIGEIREKKKTKREERRVDEEREIIRTLAICNQELVSTINSLNKYNDSVKSLDGSTDGLQRFTDSMHRFIEDYNKLMEYVNNIYRKMLQNEERFSMSYGFSRYINVFRVFVQSKKILINTAMAREDFYKYIESHRESSNPEELVKYANCINSQINILMGYLKEILPYSEEIELKYGSNQESVKK